MKKDSDVHDGFSRNSKRASVHKKIRAHDLKERISGTKLVRSIERDIEKISVIAAEIPGDDQSEYSAADHRRVLAELNAAKIKLNARFRLLNKVLPDAKDSDFDGPDNDPPKLTLRIVR